MCLALKLVRHKRYGDLQFFFVPTHQWKDLSMDFVTRLPVSIKWKGKNYDSILVIINSLMKMVHYKPVKITIHAPDLAEVIVKTVMRHHGL